MQTRQERLNYAIAQAQAERRPVDVASTGEQIVTCIFCDGTGIEADTRFPHIPLCKACNGKGTQTVAKPKPVKYDFGLTRKEKQA